MNFDKGHNVFSDIPGFDASKGERIVKALQKLWRKIEHLEQIRILEGKSCSKEVQASSGNEDLTITDVQYKLLVLQLQYIRSILRQKSDQPAAALEGHQTLRVKNDESQMKTVSQETQTGGSLMEGWNQQPDFPSIEVPDPQISIDTQVLQRPSDCPPSKLAQGGSKPHYRLKLDDVPFILGASSTASHSVVANVQNIIAMMKSHNRALCGPRQQVSRQLPADTHATGDATKMLNELSRDLHELTLKQEKLARKFDAQGNRRAQDFEVDDMRKAQKPVNGKSVPCERRPSHSVKEKDVQCSGGQSVRGPSINPPITARRKLLRSLQNFKTHLSEEDISWD